MTACRTVVLRIAASCALSLAAVLPAQAATIFVTNAGDLLRSGDGCSLREAVINANTDSRAGSYECETGSGRDVIVLPPKRILLSDYAGGQEEALDPTVGDLDILDDLEIVGGGEQLSLIDGLDRNRIFEVKSGVSLTVRRVTLTRGRANTEGGAIRAGNQADLRLEDVVFDSSRVGQTSGRGGALYLGAFSTANIFRSAFSANSASVVGGRGAGVYCDRCTFNAHATTFSYNSAAYEGGGIYMTANSRAGLSFVTLYGNSGPAGAAIHSYGQLRLNAVLSADNGIGAAGDDVNCLAGGSFSATYTFAEFPSTECRPFLDDPTGMQTRADLGDDAVAFPALLKAEWRDWQSSTVFVWTRSEVRTNQILPASLCVEPSPGTGRLVDQLGRRLPEGSTCEIGAAQYPWVFGVGTSVLKVQSGGEDAPIALWSQSGTLPVGVVDRDTQIVIRGMPGAAEDCSFTPVRTVIAADTQGVAVLVDPDSLFQGIPVLGRPDRVCEVQAEVESGDPRLIGATSSPIRIQLTDTRSSQDIAQPGHNELLDFGYVALGAGGTANVLFRAQASGWTMTVPADAISADADSRFSVTAGTRGISTNGTSLPVTCRSGGDPGDYEAALKVLVSDGASTWTYNFGLRCRVRHTLALSAEPRPISEGDTMQVALLLDSPSVLDTPFQVRLVALGGTATEDDYAFSPADGLVTFMPGERQQIVTITAIDDDEIEPIENLQFGIEIVGDVLVRPLGAVSLEVSLVSEDVIYQGLAISSLEGLPVRTPAGTRLDNIRALVMNVSHPEAPAITSVNLALSVDMPVWVRSFVVRQCGTPVDGDDCPTPQLGECQLSPSKRAANCRFPKALAVGESVEALAIVDMAEVRDAPSLEVSGVMRLTATGSSGGVPVSATAEQDYFITGLSSGAGGSFGLHALLVAMLLAFRGLRRRPGGGKVRRGVFHGRHLPAD